MGWINPPVVILDHLSLLKPKFARVKANRIFVRNLYVQGNFINTLGDILVFVAVELVSLVDAVAVVQDRLNQLLSNSPSSVGGQDGQCHNVQAVFRVAIAVSGGGAVVRSLLGCFVFEIVGIYGVSSFFHRFDARADGSNNKSVVVGKFVQVFIVAFDNVLVEAFVISDWKGDSVDFAKLFECTSSRREEITYSAGISRY